MILEEDWIKQIFITLSSKVCNPRIDLYEESKALHCHIDFNYSKSSKFIDKDCIYFLKHYKTIK